MPTSPIVQLLIAFAAAGLLFALWKGGAAERISAAIVGANLAAGVIVAEAFSPARDMLRFVIDGLTALALLAVALRYAAPWMGAVMLLYALQFSLHAYYIMTTRDRSDYLHAVLNNVNFSGIIWCLVIGTGVAWRRRAKAGPG
jgi:hypothetical protein